MARLHVSHRGVVPRTSSESQGLTARFGTSSKQKHSLYSERRRSIILLPVIRPLALIVLAGLMTNYTINVKILNIRMNHHDAEALVRKETRPSPEGERRKDAINRQQRVKPTKRFVSFRKQLSKLVYAEEDPTTNTSNSPLFNKYSPQHKALEWLANVDKPTISVRFYSENVVQRYVLAVLYYSTGGPTVTTSETDFSRKHKHVGAWSDPTNFLSPIHECEWKSGAIEGARGRGGGVRRCDKNKTVVEISLYNELSGTLPTELGMLWNLRTLYLGRNKLHGTIPTELGMISKLSSLSLQYNELSGSIPQGHLKNLFRLRALQLEGNSFTGTIDKHSLLCQMTRKYRDRDLPKGKTDVLRCVLHHLRQLLWTSQVKRNMRERGCFVFLRPPVYPQQVEFRLRIDLSVRVVQNVLA